MVPPDVVMREDEAASIHVVRAVIVRDGALLLLRRSRSTAFGGLWELPGGKTDDEPLQKAIARELHEESGLQVISCGPVVHRHRFGIYLEHSMLVDTIGTPRLSHEHDALLWQTVSRPMLEQLSEPASVVMEMLRRGQLGR